MDLPSSRLLCQSPSSSEEHLHGSKKVRKSFGDTNSYSREHLRKWKSLEGDWRTFKDLERCQAANSEDGESTSDPRFTPDPKFDGVTDEEEWRSLSRSSTNEDRLHLEVASHDRLQCFNASPAALRLFRESIEKSVWSSDPVGLISSRFDKETQVTGRPSSRTGGRYSYDSFQVPPLTQNRQEFHDVVNSSYPLLKENFSLLEKLKKERDVCRQLENDMQDLEGQIQDVSKSFELEKGLGELCEIELRDSGEDSEVGYSSEAGPNSPRLSNSFEQIYQEDDALEEEYGRETTHIIGATDPLLVIENTFSQLLLLAERLESGVRERDLELAELEEELHSQTGSHPIHALSREWLRMGRSRELSQMPAELVGLLNDLQAALRALLANKDWFRCREHGDCSSPASFTFQGFSDSQVIVPTVRTIFSPVGNSVEMRPIAANDKRNSDLENCDECQTQEEVKEESRSTSSVESRGLTTPAAQDLPDAHHHAESYESAGDECPEDPIEPEDTQCDRQNATDLSGLPSESPPIQKKPEVAWVERPWQFEATHERCSSEITYGTDYHASSEIIKRIERLQELVKPELCESLKQRALKIQKAKEEFLSGVSMPNVSEEICTEPLDRSNDIIVDKLTLPNGLSVKEEESEEKRGMFPFLRKKKRESRSQEELSRQSLILEDRADWLRNPFRPKGKYKINK